jgi:hypothetical protein
MLLKQLNVQEKSALLKYKIHAHKDTSFVQQELQFHPKINSQSKIIAENHDLNGLPVQDRL